MPRSEEEYEQLARGLALELGLNWNKILRETIEICMFMRYTVLKWLWERRGQLEMRSFFQHMDDLKYVAIKDRHKAFENYGYEVPNAVQIHPNLFFDFYDTLRSILILFPKPA